ncbi:hypothetical protein GGS23DRAFT_600595 [Durotheca rogersii]|uniref:uncharacterized protein n=1 Tax=Durotheca rogersii TaxID=419775 RepID=UPI002221193D|nr:uncharacterized protein GGS23DRAFT_600595 [Durotheca rogersii]KAI5859306.1 hypothetical protein GGS23DRAFT_600595 [Durotheca rogersii]
MSALDLESRSLAQFDNLVESGELLWVETRPIYVRSETLNFQFRVAGSLKRKPRTSHLSTVENAFADEDPRFSLGLYGGRHKLILNKYCVVRPQFVLHTVDFEPQRDALNGFDLGAARTVLCSLESSFMVIFNCGHDSGASVGHKHLQIIPRPPPTEHELFPDRYISGQAGNAHQVPGIPFDHSVHAITADTSGESLLQIYNDLRSSLRLGPEAPHNVILVREWMMVIPRSKAGNGMMSANAAAMLGMVWVNSEEEYEAWVKHGPLNALLEFGVPRRELWHR